MTSLQPSGSVVNRRRAFRTLAEGRGRVGTSIRRLDSHHLSPASMGASVRSAGRAEQPRRRRRQAADRRAEALRGQEGATAGARTLADACSGTPSRCGRGTSRSTSACAKRPSPLIGQLCHLPITHQCVGTPVAAADTRSGPLHRVRLVQGDRTDSPGVRRTRRPRPRTSAPSRGASATTLSTSVRRRPSRRSADAPRLRQSLVEDSPGLPARCVSVARRFADSQTTGSWSRALSAC